MISSHLFYGSVNFQTDQLIFRLISKILRPLACVTNSSQVWPDMVMIHILFDRGDYYACSDEPDLTAEAYFFSQWQSFTEVDFWSNSTIWKSKFLEFPIRWKKERPINAPGNVSGKESSWNHAHILSTLGGDLNTSLVSKVRFSAFQDSRNQPFRARIELKFWHHRF